MAPQRQEITITRMIHALPDQIYAAFTTAEGWCKWCCETAECNAIVGGKLHIYTEGYNAYGEYREIVKDRIATFTWDGDREPPILIRVLIEMVDQNTLLRFNVIGLGSDQEWVEIKPFLERIWGHVLDNLRDVMEASPGNRSDP